MLAMELMAGRSLREVLAHPTRRQKLRWADRWEGWWVEMGCRVCRRVQLRNRVPAWCAPHKASLKAAAGASYVLHKLCGAASPRTVPIDFCRGRQVALDIAEAVDHLHTRLRIMHGDLKAA